MDGYSPTISPISAAAQSAAVSASTGWSDWDVADRAQQFGRRHRRSLSRLADPTGEKCFQQLDVIDDASNFPVRPTHAESVNALGLVACHRCEPVSLVSIGTRTVCP